MPERLFLNALSVVQDLADRLILPGDTVVDATAGNGRDTLWLARLVGESGRVVALDIQQEALERTAQLLKENGMGDRVKLFCLDHSRLESLGLTDVKLVVYNLGYLPGGEKTLCTGADSTLSSLSQALKLLLPGGAVCLTVYPGHPPGAREALALGGFIRGLDQNVFDVVVLDFPNRKNHSPYPVIIQKLEGGVSGEE